LDASVALLIVVAIAAVALHWLGRARLQTIIELRKEVARLRKEADDAEASIADRDGHTNSSIADAEARAQNAYKRSLAQLWPFLQLFAKRRPPSWYHPYFSSSNEWTTEYEEKNLRTDKEWAQRAGQLLSSIQTLSGETRLVLEETVRLQPSSDTDTPLLVRTREVLASQPSALRNHNLFELNPQDLQQLERWIDFVLGLGVRQYQSLTEHARQISESSAETDLDQGAS